MTHRRLLYAICAVYLVLATVYSVTTPIFEASDELWHYPMVAYLADNGLALPVQDPAVPTVWRQEGSQPPLYYMIAAVLTSWIDTSDLQQVRQQNPHADIGVVVPDGNVNMVIHDFEREASWSGMVLAVHVVRLCSVVLGLGTVIVTYLLTRTIFPEYPLAAVGAAALNALLPMFLFIAGSVNNDNLSTLLGNLLALLIVRLLLRESMPAIRDYAIIGVVAGAGMLAKFNIGFLLPLVALALLIVSLRHKTIRPLLIGGLISGGLTILIAGWWYLRNDQLYGDPTGLNVFLDIVGRRAIPANLAQLWSERFSFLRAFWGFFGGMNVPYPDPIYVIFDLIALVGVIGAVAFVVYAIVRRKWDVRRWLPAAVTLIWIAVSFVSYLRWTAETPASQGRLMFAALSSILMWLAVGLVWWVPKAIRALPIGAVVGYFAFAAVFAPFGVIVPAYALPDFIDPLDDAQAVFTAPDGGSIRLNDARVTDQIVQPEGYVNLDLTWQIENAFSRDWSIFIHLITPDGVILGQRDIYPGNGALVTGGLQAGDAWQDSLAVWVPPAAYAPMELTVAVGGYHLPTGDRLMLDDGSQTYTVGTVELLPREDDLDVPNPIRINFGGRIELVGYEYSDLSPQAGDEMQVTLYWRALQNIEQDYIAFVHVIDPATTTIYGASDAMPANWNAPTSTWEVGTIIKDTHTFTIDEDTPIAPGIYEVEIGWYLNPGDGTFPRLRVFTPDGGMANDYAYLSRVRVLPNEDAP